MRHLYRTHRVRRALRGLNAIVAPRADRAIDVFLLDHILDDLFSVVAAGILAREFGPGCVQYHQAGFITVLPETKES